MILIPSFSALVLPTRLTGAIPKEHNRVQLAEVQPSVEKNGTGYDDKSKQQDSDSSGFPTFLRRFQSE